MAKRGESVPSKAKRAPRPSRGQEATKDGAAKPSAKPPRKEDEVPNKMQVLFGKNLRAARLKAGLRQCDIAERTGLSQQYLSLVESGQQNITLKTMTLLAKVVDHDLSTMLRSPKDRRSPK